MRWSTAALAATPGIVLAIAGLFHPTDLTVATAPTWWQLHIWLLPVFPLLGGVIVLLLRGERGWVSWIARIAAYVYAVFYTGLDVLAGIGAGYVTDRAGGPVPAVRDLLNMGNDLATYGVHAFLVAAIATGIALVRRDGRAAVPGAVVFVAAAVPFLQAHIYWPVGGLSMLGLAIGAGALALARREPA
ncbi:hypothetical protein ACQEVB_03670 [Pseudonocardia sp. CA-107938]|uniref:hypothetical protein n=1 Tax=Pseudonocardia sp. CA-107938 TaxID=3240021 RepID=UPI003D945E78